MIDFPYKTSQNFTRIFVLHLTSTFTSVHIIFLSLNIHLIQIVSPVGSRLRACVSWEPPCDHNLAATHGNTTALWSYRHRVQHNMHRWIGAKWKLAWIRAAM